MFKTPRTALDDLIAELAALLAPAEEASIGSNSIPEFPCVFIVGNSRCGSTLMLQWLAASSAFCYPTNLLARFYASPYIGARIQQMLTDPRYQHFEEFKEIASDGNYASNRGKTNGLLAPHEFWHFWRRFIPTYYIESIVKEQQDLINAQGIRNGLAVIQRVFGKPLAMKGKMFNFNIGKLHEICPNSLFLHLKRDPVMVAQSIYLARKTIPANKEWFGVRPPEYAELLKQDIHTQVAGQVHYTDKHIENQLAEIPEECVLNVEYDSFCTNTSAVYDALVAKLFKLGHCLPADHAKPENFIPSRSLRIPEVDFEKLSSALNMLQATAPL